MSAVGAYILTIVASALICGGLRAMFRKNDGISALIRSLCGIYMVFVLIWPLKEFDITLYTDYFSDYMDDAREAVNDGEEMALKELSARIKAESEAYILDKAISLGADVSAEVILSGSAPPTPSQITIKGAVSPYVKTVLSRYIKEQLGIPEEAQNWR